MCKRNTLQSVIAIVACVAAYFAMRWTSGQPVWPALDRPETFTEQRARLVKENGGTAESEAAVERGLSWLAKQQKEDGHWEFDGSSKDHVAATGMALLPFLAAGETHKGKKTYQRTVEKGLNWLIGDSRTIRVVDDGKVKEMKVAALDGRGKFETATMYAQAIATIAACEAAARTLDPAVRAKAKKAVEFVVAAQGRNGSWGYQGSPPTEGDTSITGWQIEALAAADRAGIEFDKEAVYAKANKFLESVSEDGGAKYGYREKGASQTLTPVGLLSRNIMGELPRRHPAFGRGVEFIKAAPPAKDAFDVERLYYASRVMFVAGGDDWSRDWNPRVRDLLVELQDKDPGDNQGSWAKDQRFIGQSCGRVGTTAMALLTLEVYYRYAPLPAPADRVRELIK
jgi:hypothetical protein